MPNPSQPPDFSMARVMRESRKLAFTFKVRGAPPQAPLPPVIESGLLISELSRKGFPLTGLLSEKRAKVEVLPPDFLTTLMPGKGPLPVTSPLVYAWGETMRAVRERNGTRGYLENCSLLLPASSMTFLVKPEPTPREISLHRIKLDQDHLFSWEHLTSSDVAAEEQAKIEAFERELTRSSPTTWSTWEDVDMTVAYHEKVFQRMFNTMNIPFYMFSSPSRVP